MNITYYTTSDRTSQPLVVQGAAIYHWRPAKSSTVLAVLLTADTSPATSSRYLSTDRRRAFMKKFTTVETLSPSCSAIVAWISLLGRLISRNIATKVRLWISVNTIRGFFCDGCCCCWFDWRQTADDEWQPIADGTLADDDGSNAELSRLRLHPAQKRTHKSLIRPAGKISTKITRNCLFRGIGDLQFLVHLSYCRSTPWVEDQHTQLKGKLNCSNQAMSQVN